MLFSELQIHARWDSPSTYTGYSLKLRGTSTVVLESPSCFGKPFANIKHSIHIMLTAQVEVQYREMLQRHAKHFQESKARETTV